jgi:dihydroflavonol-4-reductase
MNLSMKRILVTGGNGHLGYNLIKILLQRGYHVRASIRNLKDQFKVRHLENLNVELMEADLLDPVKLEKAIQGMDGVFHSAAPNLPWSPNLEQDIARPMIEGTQNVLKAAVTQKVKKVVFTSTCAAVGMDAPEHHPLTEANWNLQAKAPLIRCKMEAERWAHNFCDKTGLTFVSLCPPSIVGPGFFRHTPGTLVYEKILKGKLPGLPKGGCHLADVRDVALAHCVAYEKPSARGRYIVAGQFFDFSDFIIFLKKLAPELKGPRFIFPVWALHGIRTLDWAYYHLSGQPRQLTGALIREFAGKFQRVTSHKAENELEWKPRPAAETIQDTFQWIQKTVLHN